MNSITRSNEHSGLISFRIDWFDVLAVQGTLKKVKVKLLSRVQLFVTPWTVTYQASLSVGFFSGKSTGVGCHFLLQGIFSTQGSNPGLLHCRQSLPAEPQGKSKNTGVGSLSLFQGIFPTQELNSGLLHCRQILYH